MQKPSRVRELSGSFVVSFVLLISTHSARASEVAGAKTSTTNVVCRAQLAAPQRQLLAHHLREITGWPDLHFDARGGLHYGNAPAKGGSAAARELLTAAIAGNKVIVIEDASRRDDVVFCHVSAGVWKRPRINAPRAFVVLIDFADYSHITGDRAAQAAFNPGWGLLHEIAHAVHDVNDAEAGDDLGECERLINRMRQECGLAERAEYWYRLFPNPSGSAFSGRFVRLAFVRRPSNENKKQHYWLMWDTNLVGKVRRTDGARSALR